MTNNAPQTTQPPQAPSKPVVAQQALNELIDYYRQLADYHQSSVNYHQQLVEQHSFELELVEKQMANIEALLDPLKKASLSENGAVNPKQIDEPRVETISTDSTVELPITEERESTETESISESNLSNGKTTADTETAEAILSDNRESIEEETSRAESNATKAKATEKSKSSGSKSRGGKKSRSTTKKAKKPFSSRLPYSPLLEPYETISDAVAGCLQEHYPQVMSGDDILQYYYPDGLSGETKTRAYGAFSNTLSKGAGQKGWIKESIGKYRWREGI